MTGTTNKWRKSEGGVVGRFGDPRKALKPVALIVGDSDINPTRQAVVVDPGLRLKQLKLRLVPRVDESQLEKFTEQTLDALGLTLVLRDPSVRRFSLIQDWYLNDLPESVPLDEVPEFDRLVQDRMILSVALTALRDNEQLEMGATVARKDFHIHTEASGTQFPHQFVDSQYFASQGLPKSTSWFVHIFNEDGDLPADETFIVYINRELTDAASSKSADAIWASLATETFAALLTKLLKGNVPDDPISGSILEQLERQVDSFGYSLADIAEWARESESSRIMALSQSIAKMNTLLRGVA